MKEINHHTFGINVKQWCKEHEQNIQSMIDSKTDKEKILSYHLEKLKWLQHERLIHLLVTALTAILDTLFIYIALQIGDASITLVIILTILLAFYLYHYFFLENRVQHWYVIAENLMEVSK